MFGTVARMQILPGHEEEVRQLAAEWGRERAPRVNGFVAAYVLWPEKGSNEVLNIAIFRDRETYFANANDPTQDAWYRRLRAHLATDPVWEDGTIQSIS